MSRPGRARKEVDYAEKTVDDIPTRTSDSSAKAVAKAGTPKLKITHKSGARPVATDSDEVIDLCSGSDSDPATSSRKKAAATTRNNGDVSAVIRKRKVVISSSSDSSDDASSSPSSESEDDIVTKKPPPKLKPKAKAASPKEQQARAAKPRVSPTSEPKNVPKIDEPLVATVTSTEDALVLKEEDDKAEVAGLTAVKELAVKSAPTPKSTSSAKSKGRRTGAGKKGTEKQGSTETTALAIDLGPGAPQSTKKTRLIDTAPPAVNPAIKAVPLTGMMVPSKAQPIKVASQPAFRVGLSRKSLGKGPGLHSYLSKDTK